MRSERSASPLRGLLLFLLGGLVGANATYFLMSRDAISPPSVANVPATNTGMQIPVQSPAPLTRLGPDGIDTAQRQSGPILPLPVARINGTANGSGSTPVGRSHDAIDIMAAAGTPVLAVADGHVEKLFNSKLGGLTIYEFNPDGTLAYYYAHLQRYAEGVTEQQAITRGQVIGYVGSTGDASPDAPHLHFAIFKLGPEKQWWKGDAINPYPELGGTPR